MKVEVLYFDGCPTYKTAEKTLQKVLAEEGIDAEVELVAVSTYEEAKRLRFPGSPTIRLDGHDLFPAPECEDWRLGCRVYATPEGLRGSPTAEMIEKVLAMKEGYDADRDL
jgi:glutaredoxin